MSKLEGKNILITGASQGLGREMALRFGLDRIGMARECDRLSTSDATQPRRASGAGRGRASPEDTGCRGWRLGPGRLD